MRHGLQGLQKLAMDYRQRNVISFQNLRKGESSFLFPRKESIRMITGGRLVELELIV
jgi:hypothetical protein